ncbi:MAG: SUMF1/EgtB/PvdO family nonheme iron enzyme [Rikenellaceae bacterium]
MRSNLLAIILTVLGAVSCSEVDMQYEYAENFIVAYDPNGGSGEMPFDTFSSDLSDSLSANTFTLEGFDFVGWSTTTDGEAEYADQAEYTATANTILYAVWSPMAVESEMIYIDGGTFSFNFNTLCQVSISPYYIAKYEVTQAEWNEVMPINKSYFFGDNLPVERVNWYEIVEYCNARSVSEGISPYYNIDKTTIDPNNLNVDDEYKWLVTTNPTSSGYRLPTEAEWEWAARGGNKSEGYPYAGSNDIDEVGWVRENSDSRTHTVGTKAPNELGIYDMSGNVTEWCWDWFGAVQEGIFTDPTGAASGENRVCRGGLWYMQGAFAHLSLRGGYYNYDRSWDIGFRVARSVVTDVEAEQTLILVEGGGFEMVDLVDKTNRQSVKLDSFYIEKSEVTQLSWQLVMGSNPSFIKGNDLPVELVSWYDAIEYCNARSIKEGFTPHYIIDKETIDPNNGNSHGKDDVMWLVTLDPAGDGYRLPTEAEWEWAARGGNKSEGYAYSGSNSADAVAWYNGTADNASHEVCTKQPNELGIYDMSGNMYEWCWDWLGSYQSGLQENPTGASSGNHRIVRGGCWGEDYSSTLCNVAYRAQLYPTAKSRYIGLRVIRSI